MSTPPSYCHAELLRAIQEPLPEHDVAVHAVRAAKMMVQDMQRALRQAEQQLLQAQTQLQQITPARQKRWQLVRKLQAMQCACWNPTLSAELSGLVLGKTSRYNVRMMAVSCPLLRDTANAAEPIRFEASPWSRMRIAAGGYHTLCVSAGGSVFAWGRNDSGQLGVGHRAKRVVPTLVTGLLQTKSVVQVAAGYNHTAWLTADGVVFTSGSNGSGRLGLGDGEHRVVPTLVGALQGTKVVQVAAGSAHTMCVTEDGVLFTFGRNANGQLGSTDRENRLVPTQIRGELRHLAVVQVAAGNEHSACATVDGSAFAWGLNTDGQLGIGGTGRRVVPTLVTGQLKGKRAIYLAAGDFHTVCLTADSSMLSWGRNSCSQLGVGDNDQRSVPTLVGGLQGKSVIQVAAGAHHTVCTTADGSVFSWGSNDNGVLGLGDLGSDGLDRTVPASVRGELRKRTVVQASAGDEHSACVTEDGSVYVWGANDTAQLGLGVANDDCVDLPVLVDVNAIK